MALVDGAVAPLLFAVAVLQVVEPLAFVVGTGGTLEDTPAARLVVDPLASVSYLINMGKLAGAVCFVVLPLPVIDCSVGPALQSLAVTLVPKPLTLVELGEPRVRDSRYLAPCLDLRSALRRSK